MSEQFWMNWLKAASALVIGFGFLIVAAAHPAGVGPMLFFADLLIWPFDGNPAAMDQLTRLISAISGGIMVGWGVLLWMVTAQVLPRLPEIGRRLILASIISWFVVDSTGSVVSGVPLNLVGNLLFLIAFVVPVRALANAKGNAAMA